MTLLPQSVEDWREFTLTRGPRMAAEAFLLKLAEIGPAEQRAALCGLPDTRTLTRRFEEAWPLRESALGGVPFLTKDLYFRAGEPTYAGSTFLPDEIGPAQKTSTLPAAFETDAGAIECGRARNVKEYVRKCSFLLCAAGKADRVRPGQGNSLWH